MDRCNLSFDLFWPGLLSFLHDMPFLGGDTFKCTLSWWRPFRPSLLFSSVGERRHLLEVLLTLSPSFLLPISFLSMKVSRVKAATVPSLFCRDRHLDLPFFFMCFLISSHTSHPQGWLGTWGRENPLGTIPEDRGPPVTWHFQPRPCPCLLCHSTSSSSPCSLCPFLISVLSFLLLSLLPSSAIFSSLPLSLLNVSLFAD